jgi:hypothetical protein
MSSTTARTRWWRRCTLEQWYLTRLWQVPRFPAQKTVLLRLQVVREAAERLLAASDLTLSDRVVDNGGEAWTLRKVLRRFLEHEREHMLEIVWRLHQTGLPAFPPTNSRASSAAHGTKLHGDADHHQDDQRNGP